MNSAITNRFTYHAPTPATVIIYETMREKAKDLALWMDEVGTESRELSLAITHLDQAVMWFNASVARNTKE